MDWTNKLGEKSYAIRNRKIEEEGPWKGYWINRLKLET